MNQGADRLEQFRALRSLTWKQPDQLRTFLASSVRCRIGVESKHDNVSAGGNRLNCAGSIEPVHDRHGEVDNHHVGPQLSNSIDSYFAILGLAANYPARLLFPDTNASSGVCMAYHPLREFWDSRPPPSASFAESLKLRNTPDAVHAEGILNNAFFSGNQGNCLSPFLSAGSH